MLKKYSSIIQGLVLILLFVLFIQFVLIPFLNAAGMTEYLQKHTAIAAFVVIFYTVLSHIFAPVIGTPIHLISLSIFGIVNTISFIFIANMVSSVICFWISRKYGRVLVIKLVGKKTMDQVDSFAKDAAVSTLIISRLIGFSIFEVVSYAFGLTLMPFRTYMFITFFATFIPFLFLTFFFGDSDFTSNSTLIPFILILAAIEALYVYFLYKRWKKAA